MTQTQNIPAKPIKLYLNPDDNGEITSMSLKFIRNDTGDHVYVRLFLTGKSKSWTEKKLAMTGFNGDIDAPEFSAQSVDLCERTGEGGYVNYDIVLQSSGGDRKPINPDAKERLQSQMRALFGGRVAAKPSTPPPAVSAPPPVTTPPPVAAAKPMTKAQAWEQFKANSDPRKLNDDWVAAVTDVANRTGRGEESFTSRDWNDVVSQATPL